MSWRDKAAAGVAIGAGIALESGGGDWAWLALLTVLAYGGYRLSR